MTDKDFCRNDAEYYGEVVDNIQQIGKRSFTGDELKEYVEHHIAQQQVKKCDLADVGGNKVAVCNHPFEKLDWSSETRIDCECGESFFRWCVWTFNLSVWKCTK